MCVHFKHKIKPGLLQYKKSFIARISIYHSIFSSYKIEKQIEMSNNSNTYLFYSNACVHCIELLKVIKDLGILNKLKLICVDKVDHSKLPKFVKSVPTMFFKESNQVMTGESIFQWLNKQYGTRSEQGNVNSTSGNRTCNLGSRNDTKMNSVPDKEDNDIIEAWIETEWGNNSFSDSYSFLSDCPGGVCRNFALIDDMTNSSAIPSYSKPTAAHHIQGGGNFDFLDRSQGKCSNDDNLQVCNDRLQQMKMEREKFY